MGILFLYQRASAAPVNRAVHKKFIVIVRKALDKAHGWCYRMRRG